MRKFKELTLAVVVLFIISYCFGKRFTQRDAYRDTIREFFVDTIAYYKPVARDSVVIRYVTEKLKKANADTLNENADSTEVAIPIHQIVYRDSGYTAYVSGYKPNLDSIFIYPIHEVMTIGKRDKHHTPKRWNLGVQVGYGLILNGAPQFAPCFSVGVSYNLFSF